MMEFLKLGTAFLRNYPNKFHWVTVPFLESGTVPTHGSFPAGMFWHPWWVYLMVLYSALLNGAALLAQILPYGVFEQPQYSPKGGSEKKYRARPNRLWGHSKGRLGAPEPHLSGPIPPRIRPERGKPLLWPLGAGTPQQAKKKVAKWRQT